MIMTILSYTVFTGLSVLSTRRLGFQRLPLPVRPGRGRPVRRGRGAGGRSGARAGAPLCPGHGAGLLRRGQHDGGAGRHRAGPAGTVGAIAGAWRWEFLAGACPRRWRWWSSRSSRSRSSGSRPAPNKKRMGSYRELFSDPRWRRNAIVGFLLAFAGVVGLWGIGFFSYDLFRPVLEKTFRAQGLTGAALAGKTTTWIGITSLLQNLGGFFGVYAFTYLTHYTGRRKAFAVSFLAAMGMTAYTFWNLQEHQRHLLDDPADGLRPACPVRRLRHLFRRAVPHAPAQHRHQLLLQRRPLRRRRRPVHPRLPHQPRLRPTSPSPCATPASPCAWCSWSAWPPCPSLPKPRASRCRNEEGSALNTRPLTHPPPRETRNPRTGTRAGYCSAPRNARS